ncbi:MAG: putative toxin-antitoxin system toxin component, PIN family [Deltaproteobacteria bacterium]|nr:putative toxin-antitoxin system toxin component, PIN family [Deltaproteobacteria bacterium]MBW1963433.1 putative toxin-antitoxin system toxin component, PIN family [Deltaproteobacteria bacterium]MBW1996298.1 putative toxin-antitoxin system toxin component, PIN family [Deltaproteobacteria bacterium]MBW2154422.1 putative toxin-antitoxin system toxin component, PIN family [Deltaproteobacteria bacterium]
MKLKAVMDTNVLISGILWRGVPFNLLRWAEEGRLRIYTSLEILSEVYRVLHYPKFQQYIDNQQASPGELFAKIVSLCTIIQVDQVVKGVCSDADDEKFLSCALAGNVEVLVSGDKHLLDLKQYQSVRILTAQEFYQENIHKIT